MRRILSLLLPVLALAVCLTPPSSRAVCTDNDGDGETTCGIKVNGVWIYDCNDADPTINMCERSTIHYPALNYPEDCSYTYMLVTRYNCPWGGGPAPSGYQRPGDCTFISQDNYLEQEYCP